MLDFCDFRGKILVFFNECSCKSLVLRRFEVIFEVCEAVLMADIAEIEADVSQLRRNLR